MIHHCSDDLARQIHSFLAYDGWNCLKKSISFSWIQEKSQYITTPNIMVKGVLYVNKSIIFWIYFRNIKSIDLSLQYYQDLHHRNHQQSQYQKILQEFFFESYLNYIGNSAGSSISVSRGDRAYLFIHSEGPWQVKHFTQGNEIDGSKLILVGWCHANFPFMHCSHICCLLMFVKIFWRIVKHTSWWLTYDLTESFFDL